MKAMLLAAGKGKRMLPLTKTTPKPLLQAGGKPLIAYHLEKLARAGIHEVVINHAYLGQQLEQALGDGSDYGVHIRWSAEGEEPLETAGGIIHALPLLGNEPFILISADIWTDYDFADLPEVLPGDSLAHLVMVPNAPHHPGGDFVLKGWQLCLTSDDERNPTCTYSGMGVFHPQMFAGVPPGIKALLPLLESAILAQRVSAELYTGDWFDIGSPERLQALDQRLLDKSL